MSRRRWSGRLSAKVDRIACRGCGSRAAKGVVADRGLESLGYKAIFQLERLEKV